MLSILSIVGHAGTLLAFLGVGLAVLAFVYVPVPFKHYAVVLALAGAFAAQVFGEGYARADAEWQAKYDGLVNRINVETAKAVAAAEAKVREQAEANARRLREALDAQTADATNARAAYAEMAERIAKAGSEADSAAPALILETIRGGK